MSSVPVTAKPYGYYYGWNIVGVCILAQAMANALPISGFSLFLNGWSAELHAPISTLQLGLAVCGIGCAVLSPVIGALADKYPTRVMFAIGLITLALFCLGISYVTATWQFIALYAVLAPIAILFATSITGNAVVSRWFVQKLGLALGLTSFGLGLAGVVMPPIIAVALPAIGWRTLFRIAAALTLFIVLPIVVGVLRDRPSERDGVKYLAGGSGGAVGHHGATGGSDGTLAWRDVASSRNFWLLVIVFLPLLGVYGGVSQNIAPIAISRGLSPQTAGILLSLLSAAQLGGTLVVGLLSDRFGNRLPLVGLAISGTIGGVVIALGHGVILIGLGAALAGLAGAFWPLLAAAVAREFGASGAGRAFGLIMFFLPFAVLAPFAVAKLQETSGSYGPTLIVMSIITLVGGLACLLMRERPRPIVKPEL